MVSDKRALSRTAETVKLDPVAASFGLRSWLPALDEEHRLG